MEQIYNKKNTSSYVYCIILLIIIVTWTNQTAAPPAPIRLIYLIAVMIIPFFSKVIFLPAAFSCLLIVSKNGFAYSYLPQGDYNYSIALFFVFIALLAVSKTTKISTNRIPRIIVILLFYVLFVDFINNGTLEHLSHCLFITLMLFLISNSESNKGTYYEDIKIIAVLYSLSALALYYFYFRFGYLFTIEYKNIGMEAVGWTDPNYFSSTIGIMVLISFVVLSSRIKTTIVEKILFIFTSVVGLFIMVNCASRGAVLAIAISSSVLLFFSKMKWGHKVFIILLLTIFIVILFNNNFFYLLQSRIEADDNSGSGRVDIWRMKLESFSQENNLFYYLFGMGATKGLFLGGSSINYHSFHNDYVAYLVCYGGLGLMLFIMFLLSPIKKISKNSSFRPAVIASVLYLAICGLTLNPLSEGYVAFFCFYFFIHKLCEVDTIYKEN